MLFRYNNSLTSAKNFGIRKGLFSGAGMGFFFFVNIASYALAFWYGGKLVREDDYTPGRMLLVSSHSPVWERGYSRWCLSLCPSVSMSVADTNGKGRRCDRAVSHYATI